MFKRNIQSHSSQAGAARYKQRARALFCAVSMIGLLGAAPAFAETEVQALKRELAEQRALIEKLLAHQEAQAQAISKMEAQAAASAAAPATAAAPVTTTAAAAPAASLTFYGTADVNVAITNSGYGSKVSVGSGGMTASSIGVKGRRDLGDGLYVVGEAEAGVDMSTGAVSNGSVPLGVNVTAPSSGALTGSGSQIFSRQIYAGLASDSFGTLTLGRQYTGSYIAAAAWSNAMGPGFFGSGPTFLPMVGGMPTRVNNSIVYRTPNLNGFIGHLTYTAGSENNVSGDYTYITGTPPVTYGTTDKAGAGWDLALSYRTGPFLTALTLWDVNNTQFNVTGGETGLAKKRGLQAMANYDFGFMKVFGTYITGKISDGNYENVTKTLSKASGWSVSAGFPFGKNNVLFSYASIDDKSSLNRDGKLLGLAYTYELYKGTKLYGSWGKQFNNANATYPLTNGGDLVGNVSTAGYDPTGFMMGINSVF